MADEMDTCEYIWNHELAMRRLLSLLRSGQSYCTDAECIDLPTGQTPEAQSAEGDQFMWTFLVIAMTVLLYVMRPRFARRLGPNSANEKRQPPTGGGSGDDPPPAGPAIH